MSLGDLRGELCPLSATDTSSRTELACPPISFATAAAAAASTSVTTTAAPSAANRRAVAAPMPEPAAVTTATRPANRLPLTPNLP